MTSAVTDFRSISRILSRQEQKADFEEKNPKPPEWYSNLCAATWPNLGLVSYEAPETDPA